MSALRRKVASRGSISRQSSRISLRLRALPVLLQQFRKNGVRAASSSSCGATKGLSNLGTFCWICFTDCGSLFAAFLDVLACCRRHLGHRQLLDRAETLSRAFGSRRLRVGGA